MPRRASGGYRDIAATYEHLIRTGRLRPGEVLPTELELAKRYGVTRTTIRRAFQGLVNKGLVTKAQGRGTEVAAAADVESRSRSLVIIATPESRVRTAAGGFEPLALHDGIPQCVEAFSFALADVGRPFRTFYYSEDVAGIEALCGAAKDMGALGILIVDVEESETVDRLLAAGVPTIFVDSDTHEKPVDQVRDDGREGARLATKHLISTVDGPVAFLGSYASRRKGSPHNDRLDGYLAAHREAGREPVEEHIFATYVESDLVREAVGHMLSLSRPPAGWFCSDDLIAVFALEELRLRGVPVPASASVIGYGNNLVSRTVIPNLSTVAVDRRAMGFKAVELLHARLDAPDASPMTALAPVRLTLRQTTGVSVSP